MCCSIRNVYVCEVTEPEGKGSTCIREPNSLAEFVPPPNFYDDEAIANTRDEYEEYLSKPARPCDNPLEWWKAHRQEYPRLSQMALDLFSIPMMSAECERVFSSAKNLITDHRNGLKEDITV